jgi:hypothetical protein
MAAKRIGDVQIEREADEILVMKSAGTWEAHALNLAAAAVYDLCDGRASKADMAAAIQRRTGLPADEEIVDLALAELADAELVTLEHPESRAITRRAVVRRLGLTSAAVALLPVVETIVVPPASAQGSPTPTATGTVTQTATGTATQTATATVTITHTPGPTPTEL